MKKLPVRLGVSRSAGLSSTQTNKGAGSSGSSSSSQKVLTTEQKNKIFERDDFTCRFCGFQSKKYQEIKILNERKQIGPKNLATACIFCHQCFHLEKVSAMRSGVLLWLPEIEQIDLHHIARAIYVARISQGPVADAARKTLDILMNRREEVKKRISTDDPYILSMVLKDYLSPAHYNKRAEKLEGVRLFPLDRRIIKEADLEFNQFPQILAYWRSKAGPFGGKTPQQWISIYQDILSQAA